MKTFLIITGILVYCVVFHLILEAIRNRQMQKYWKRFCTGNQWRKAFPNTPKKDLRFFLDQLTNSFCFGSDRKLKFAPSDKLNDIYQTLYPYKGFFAIPDDCEMEQFAERLDFNYKFDLYAAWNEELTLGQIFQLVKDKG